MRKKMAKPSKKKMPKTNLKRGGGIKVRGTGAATKGLMARGPMG